MEQKREFDMLVRIFEMQQALDTDIEKRRNISFTREEWIQKEVLALTSELVEVLDEVNFKWWKNEKPVDDAKLHEEIVDVLHFFVSMCIRSGLSADKLFELYCSKNLENFDRQNGLSKKEGYESSNDGK